MRNKIVNGLAVKLTSAELSEVEAREAEWDAHRTKQDATQYQRDRQAEYPSTDELIVALWEGVVEERMASVTTLEGLRQAVKTKYPKL